MGANDDHETNYLRHSQLDRNHSSSSRLVAPQMQRGLSFSGCGELQQSQLLSSAFVSAFCLSPIRRVREYFFLCTFLFYHISKERHTHVLRRSLSSFLASLPLLYSASSAPALMSWSSGRSCARSRHSSCPPSGESSLLGGITNSSPYLFHCI